MSDILSKPMVVEDLIEILKQFPPGAPVKIHKNFGQWEQHYSKDDLTRRYIQYDSIKNEVEIGN